MSTNVMWSHDRSLSAARVAPLQAGGEAESGNRVRQTEWAALGYTEETAEDILPIPWTASRQLARAAMV